MQPGGQGGADQLRSRRGQRRDGGGIGLGKGQVVEQGREDGGPELRFGHLFLALGADAFGKGLIGARSARQGGFGLGRREDRRPDRRVLPARVDAGKSLFSLLADLVGAASGGAKDGGDAGVFVVEARAELGVVLFLGGDLEIEVQRLKDGFAGNFLAIGVPVLQRDDGARQRVADDLVFDRAEQHVRDRRDEGHEDEDQKRRDQHQRADLLAPQRARQTFLQRRAIGSQHRAVLGDVAHRSPVSRQVFRNFKTNGVEGAVTGPFPVSRSLRKPSLELGVEVVAMVGPPRVVVAVDIGRVGRIGRHVRRHFDVGAVQLADQRR